MLQIRKAPQLQGVAGLVIPGGESTTMALVAERWGLVRPLGISRWLDPLALGFTRPSTLCATRAARSIQHGGDITRHSLRTRR
jgi:hypothetical protein